MKILIIAPPFRSIPVDNYGAVEKLVYERGLALTALGHEVSYVAPQSSVIPFSKTTYFVNKIEPTVFKSSHKVVEGKFPNPITYIRSLKTFFPLNVNENYDFVYNDSNCFDPINLLNFIRLFGFSRQALVLHGNTSIGEKFRGKSVLRRLRLAVLNRNLYNFLTSRGWSASYLPNGLLFPVESDINKYAKNYLIFVGRINRTKGVTDAIKFSKLVNMKLFIFGWIQDQSYFTTEIQPLLDESVVFMGDQPRKILNSYLRNADALLFMSNNNDPQPTVLSEALSYGVPIVARNPGYYSSFYDICNEGNSVTSKDLQTLSDNFKSIYKLDRMEIYRVAKSNWSWESVIKNWHIPAIEKLI